MTDEVIGGLHVRQDGQVEFNVPFRLVLARGVTFPRNRTYDATALQQVINDCGRAKGGARWKDVKVVKSHVSAGGYFPRIARPSTDHPNDPPGGHGLTGHHLVEYRQAIISLKSLLKQFVEIADVLYPASPNLIGYGPKIRSLLILSCTKFEAASKAVLRENGYNKSNTNISDYQKLETAMRLSDYLVSVPEFPEVQSIRPFEDWKNGNNLKWYKAYNDSKHDRHLHFADASLAHALQAMLGCFILLTASYGWVRMRESLNSFAVSLTVVEFPSWELGHMYRRAKKVGGGQYELDSIHTPLKFTF